VHIFAVHNRLLRSHLSHFRVKANRGTFCVETFKTFSSKSKKSAS